MSTEAQRIQNLIVEVTKLTKEQHPRHYIEQASITAAIGVFSELFGKMDSRIKELEKQIEEINAYPHFDPTTIK